MPLDRDLADVLTVVGAASGLLAVVLAVTANLRVRRLRRTYDVIQGGGRQEDFLTAVSRHVTEVEALRHEVGGLHHEVTTARADISDAIRHVAVVRYDAFPDMGGRLSFSAALLDDAGDGLVLTSINGRTETRSYAKGVKNGKSEHSLSPEEQQAIGFATGRR